MKYFITMTLALLALTTFADYDIAAMNESLKPIPLQFDHISEESISVQLADYTPAMASAGVTQKVAILVDKPLYGHIASGVSNYVSGAAANLPIEILEFHNQEWSTQSFEQVRAFIKNLWQTEDIDGVILVGFFPHMRYNLPGQVRYNHGGGQIGMIGYEDLSGEFQDLGAWELNTNNVYEFVTGPPNGIYDHHVWKTGGGSYDKWTDATLDIWCAIMRPFQSVEGSVEYTPAIIEQMTKYFDKLDRYYKAEMVVPQRGLSWANKDWGNQTTYLGGILKGNYGNDHVDQIGGSGIYNSGQDYMHALGRGYEMCSYWSHSAGWFHNNDRWPWVDIQNYELLNRKGRGSMITWGFNCHGSDYSETPTTGGMSQNYTFSGIGQAYISSAMSYGVSYINNQMSNMINDDICAGEAFRAAVEHEYRTNPYGLGDQTAMTIICQTFTGNPLLYTSKEHRISAPPATATGSFYGMNQKTECKILKDQELFSYEYPASNGDFEFNFLEAGNYSVEVRTLGGLLIDTFEFDITEGESKNLGSLDIGVADTNSDIWTYKLANSMPGGWTDVNTDMGTNAFGPAPFGQQGDRGTFLNFSSRLYIRKTFVVNQEYATGPILLNVRSYKTTQDTGANINGINVALTTTGISPDYWLLSTDMSEYLVPGTNVVIVWGKNYLDASAPEYELDLKPHLAVSPQLYYPENQISKSLKLYNTGTNQISFTVTSSENNGWLCLNTTSGTFSNIGEINSTVSRYGLDTGVYFDEIYIDAGIAGSTTVTVAMAIGLDESLASADWDDSMAGANPNGNWEYAYSKTGAGDFPYEYLPYHFQTGVGDLDYVWLSDLANYNSKIGFAAGDQPGNDITMVVGNLTDKATAIGWRAPEDGVVHAVRGYWTYPDPASPVKANLDLVMENNQVQSLYEYSATGMTTCGGAILSTSSVYVVKDDIIYLTFSPNTETLILPPIKLLGENCDLCVSFEPGVPEPVMGSIFFGLLLLLYKFNRK